MPPGAMRDLEPRTRARIGSLYRPATSDPNEAADGHEHDSHTRQPGWPVTQERAIGNREDEWHDWQYAGTSAPPR